MYKAALEVRRSASTPVLQSPNGPQSSLPPAKPVAFSFWPAHALGSFILREGNRISKHGSARADRSRRARGLDIAVFELIAYDRNFDL